MSNTVLYEQERHGAQIHFRRYKENIGFCVISEGENQLREVLSQRPIPHTPGGTSFDRWGGAQQRGSERVHGGRFHSPTTLHDEKCGYFLLSS